MKLNRALLLAISAVVLAGLLFSYFYWSAVSRRAGEQQTSLQPLTISAELEEAESQEQPIELLIYRPSARNPGRPYETKVVIQVAASADRITRARQIVQAVVSEMSSVVPAGSVEQVYLLDNGLAVVDFSRDVAAKLRGGAGDEYAVLLSLTRSLMNNLEGMQDVRFLVGGLEQPTLAGHISLATPFR